MPSTINADNGVVSGSSGVKTTADTSGVLALQSNGSTGLTLGTDLSVTSVNYISGVGLRSLTAGGVRFYNAGNSNYSFITTPAGTGDMQFETGAGEQMRLTGTGLGLGTTSPSAKLHVEGGTENAIIGSSTRKIYFRADGNGVSVLDAAAQAGNGFYVNSVSSYVATYTGSAERLRIASAGQIGIGGANYGTAGQVLTSGGSGAAPSWSTPSAGTTMLFAAFSSTGGF